MKEQKIETKTIDSKVSFIEYYQLERGLSDYENLIGYNFSTENVIINI